jgi:hypothetical protein
VRSRIAQVVWLVMLLVACRSKDQPDRVQASPSGHELVGATGEGLRAAFNADVAKIRLLILVAPT